MNNLTLGKTAVVTAYVTESNTAKAVGSGSLDVFATPMMVALMENAACSVLADGLESGLTSVGTAISIAHTAASPIGAKVSAAATITAVNGRSVDFAVTANDETGEIGVGTHTRVIVDEAKFVAKAANRYSEK
ncbi:MAG: thioesterase family protein [Oscillospiraceae bacterium]|jgi:predicted thioesterase|nr:thioesterase family protein [Oscillospiraceae bacterium]